MYRHTVVFSLHASSGSAEEAAFLDAADRELAGIPGVSGFAISRQVSPKTDIDWQFSMDFDDEEAFTAYAVHPTHVAFVESRWVPDVARFHEYDFIAR